MSLLVFTLSMPGRNSWNGRWSGQDRIYARVKNLGPSKKAEAKAQSLIDRSPYYYAFGDGWTACVTVRAVSSEEARRIRKTSQGFCGYDWMIHSILDKQAIEA